ncbi:MAG: alpha/beta hydrolase [Mucilaginibacter polytrichastri]|nr:alpha/beta hydrolase [Mucilaginibacter polytrichastri]
MMKRFLTLLFVLVHGSLVMAQEKPDQEWYLQREDLDIFVKETGAGTDTVIVIHGGFGANHDYMLDAIRPLKDRYRFILYDQRGSLLSPTKAENLTFPKNVGDLLALADALKLKRVKLFCHSMGTLVGMEFARQHPERVSHLVLAGSLLPKSDSLKSIFSARHDEQVHFLSTRKAVSALLQPFKEKGVDSLRSIADIDRFGFSHKELSDYWRIQFAAVNVYDMRKFPLVKGGRAYYKPAASVMVESVNWNYDYRKRLNNGIKTTFINGNYDFFDFDGRVLEEQLKTYPNVQVAMIPDAGHNSWIDQPERFADDLHKALSR